MVREYMKRDDVVAMVAMGWPPGLHACALLLCEGASKLVAGSSWVHCSSGGANAIVAQRVDCCKIQRERLEQLRRECTNHRDFESPVG